MIRKIVIIGPESTGKSTLAQELATHFETSWVPEYAREYLLTNGMAYEYEDLLTIAKGQLALEDEQWQALEDHSLPLLEEGGQLPLFVDTDMYVMKVWCEFVFGKCHSFILEQIVDHDGFDWKSIRKAMEYNKKKPGRVRGGSTISQQVAKNVFLWQGRSFIRKGLEVYFTFMIELIWGKERILEVYLNVIEMGDGIFGIERAANIYFNKSAKNLTQQESALIAACLPNPKRYKVKPPSRYVSARSRQIMQQMRFLAPDPDIKKVIDASD